jgi:tRNA dimethylallyltransferase
MFDVINDPINFTIADYRSKITQLIHEIWQRNKLPVLVGGSGFYLRSLFFPPQVSSSQASSSQLDESDITTSPLPYPPGTDLWHELNLIDPERARRINKNDIYRIERALSIWHSTREKPSSFSSHYDPIAPFKLMYLTRDRADLYNRINERVLFMLKNRWIDEVQALLNTPWESFIMKKKIIGYDNLIAYLRNQPTNNSLQETTVAIQQRTRHYAKRQMTYWRMLKKEIESVYCTKSMVDKNAALPFVEVNLTTGDLDLYIKRLLA